MIQTIKNIFGGYSKQIKVLQNKLNAAQEYNEELQNEIKSQSIQIQSYQKKIDKHNNIEPWFTIVAEGLDPIRGIQTTMDWNDAFLQYLKDSGFADKDEFIKKKKWILILHEDTISKIEERIIENSTLIKENQFT